MDWSPQSLNINPIKLLWNDVDGQERKIQLTIKKKYVEKSQTSLEQS